MEEQEILAERIDTLIAAWHEGTMFQSSSVAIFEHWAMQRIIGIAEAAPLLGLEGNPVLDILLDRVSEHIHLHWALCYLTREEPPASEPKAGGFVATDLQVAAAWWIEYAQRPDRRVRSVDGDA